MNYREDPGSPLCQSRISAGKNSGIHHSVEEKRVDVRVGVESEL